MDWSWSTWWWIATGALVAAELVTGTFYLLMLALGTAVAALVGMAGLGIGGARPHRQHCLQTPIATSTWMSESICTLTRGTPTAPPA
jgi:hypothetical protein